MDWQHPPHLHSEAEVNVLIDQISVLIERDLDVEADTHNQNPRKRYTCICDILPQGLGYYRCNRDYIRHYVRTNFGSYKCYLLNSMYLDNSQGQCRILASAERTWMTAQITPRLVLMEQWEKEWIYTNLVLPKMVIENNPVCHNDPRVGRIISEFLIGPLA